MNSIIIYKLFDSLLYALTISVLFINLKIGSPSLSSEYILNSFVFFFAFCSLFSGFMESAFPEFWEEATKEDDGE
jgi:hypothetical protein